MSFPFSIRLRSLRARLRRSRASAALISHRPNIFYLTGFTGDNALLLASMGRPTLFTDPRFELQATQECQASRTRVVVSRKALALEAGTRLARSLNPPRVLYEADRLAVSQYRTLRRAAGHHCSWMASQGLVETFREVKDSEEVSRIREAAWLGSRVMEQVIKLAQVGVTENDLAAEIEYLMRKGGAEGPSFETIVASGARSALPHGRATSKRLKEKDLVVIDLGVILRGYCSDLTRTIHLGKASQEVRNWYRAVLLAQTEARNRVRAGVAASDVDAAVRGVLRPLGLERYFIHSTGHGLGLEVHERPSLRTNQSARLKPGSVVTIEPGIYIPGRGGIRIEDDVLVRSGGSETLTTASRELIEV